MSGCLELKIIVRYEGLKATQYFSKFTNRSEDVFRDDLLALKLPHPKRGNTTFISHGCVECVWPLVPKNGILHKHVMARTNPRNASERDALGVILGQLSISNIAVKEIYPDAGKGRKYLKRPNPFTSEGGVKEGSSSKLPSSQGNGYQPPPNTGTSSLHVSEAEAFLQDVSDSFRPRKMLKVEPVEVPLPPAAPRSVRKLKLHRSSSSSLSSHLSSTSKTTNPPESASSSSSLKSQKPPQAKVIPPAPANHMPPPPSKPLPPTTTPISEVPSPIRIPKKINKLTKWGQPILLPAPILAMLRELQPLLSKPQPLPEPEQRQPTVPDQNMTPPIPTQPEPAAKPRSIVPDQNMSLPIPTQPEPAAQLRSIVSDQKKMSPPIIPTQPKSFEATTTTSSSNSKSRPNASDMPEIQRLTRESCDIRRQINADSVRDASIIAKLKQLNSPYIPGPLKVGNPDSIMEGRIRKLEQDLDTERRMRLEAEDVVRDIRRECKAPFIVPGLLDAFIKLSRLTTQATSLNGTVTKDNDK